jgi:hypothetical protein
METERRLISTVTTALDRTKRELVMASILHLEL